MSRSVDTSVDWIFLRLSLHARGGYIYGPGGYGTAVAKSENTPMRALPDPAGLEVR